MKNKTKRKIKYLLLAVLLVALISVSWIFRPPTHYDKSKVDRRLASLEEPYKSVLVSYYFDGGSVAIHIVDKNDKQLKIALPVIDFNRSYDKIYFGINHHSELKDFSSAKAENPTETKLQIEDILYRYSKNDLIGDIVLCEIRGRLIDHMRYKYKDWRGYYYLEQDFD
jgi:hypothetical protein